MIILPNVLTTVSGQKDTKNCLLRPGTECTLRAGNGQGFLHDKSALVFFLGQLCDARKLHNLKISSMDHKKG